MSPGKQNINNLFSSILFYFISSCDYYFCFKHLYVPVFSLIFARVQPYINVNVLDTTVS